MRRISDFLLCFCSGLFNSLFGSGGGIISVTYLKRKKLSQKNAQATALTASLVLSVISCGYYLYCGYFSFNDSLRYLPFGIIGALFGSFLLAKIPDKLLKKLFALFILWAGARMIFK